MRSPDITDTHRRCSACRQWLPLHHYQPKQGRCEECRNKAYRDRYASLSDEEIVVKFQRLADQRRENRAQKNQKRREDALFALKLLKKRGMCPWAIYRATGVSRKSQNGIWEGTSKNIYPITVQKLYSGLEREISDHRRH